HRLEGQGGVLEGLPLGQARALGGEVDDVRGEALGGGLEADPGTGGVLEEEVHHGGADEGGQLPDRAGLGLGHVLGGGEHGEGVLAAEVGDGDEVPHARSPSPVPGRTMSTASCPSVSASWTWTRSVRAVGRFLPTWAARIVSSRWPRCTRTASRTAAGRPMALSAS